MRMSGIADAGVGADNASGTNAPIAGPSTALAWTNCARCWLPRFSRRHLCTRFAFKPCDCATR